MKTHRQQIASQLSECCLESRAFFALLGAERLRHCCWACQMHCDIDLSRFFYWINFMLDALIEKRHLSVEVASEARYEFEMIFPVGGKPLLVQAQSGIVCGLMASKILSGEFQVNLEEIVNAIIDALDNYDYSVKREFTHANDVANNYPLLEREQARQRSDLEFVRDYHQIDRSSMHKYRALNLQFTIPPAVFS